MPVDAMTARRTRLDDTLQLKQGESVAIFGASGGIGHLAVQLARRMGARVLAAASGEDGVALVSKTFASRTPSSTAREPTLHQWFAPSPLPASTQPW